MKTKVNKRSRHNKTAVLIAAAGQSSRMGSAKALLPFNSEKSFIEQLISVFLDADLKDIWVTLPENIEDRALIIEKSVSLYPDVKIISNRYMQQGLLGSLKSVLLEFENLKHSTQSHYGALIFTPIDAPFITSKDLQNLKQKMSAAKGAFQLVYGAQCGHPSGISLTLFNRLKKISSPKELFDKEHLHKIESENPMIAVNINTPEQYVCYFDLKKTIK